MLNYLALTQNNHQWSFSSEAQLEDLIWTSLETLFNLTPLQRQFTIDNQICDILAVSQDGQLTIIELKNGEDRYIVNQLTRYYDALINNKPFQESIDYSQAIQLMAIAPSFHRDNWSDKKYNRLDIQFFSFQLTQKSTNNFLFLLTNQETQKQAQIEFQYEPPSHKIEIPEPSRKLLSLLSNVSLEQRQAILGIRQQILGFHERLKEYSLGGAVIYGSAKNKSCAELRFDSKRNDIALFLWIPYATSGGARLGGLKQVTARVRIWTNWQEVTDLGHVPKGLGNMISFKEFQLGTVKPLRKLLPKNFSDYIKNRFPDGNHLDNVDKFFTDAEYRLRWTKNKNSSNPHYKSALALEFDVYCRLNNQKIIASSNQLKDFINLALQTWLERL